MDRWNEKRAQRIKDLIDEQKRVIDNQNMEIEQLKKTIGELVKKIRRCK